MFWSSILVRSTSPGRFDPVLDPLRTRRRDAKHTLCMCVCVGERDCVFLPSLLLTRFQGDDEMQYTHSVCVCVGERDLRDSTHSACVCEIETSDPLRVFSSWERSPLGRYGLYCLLLHAATSVCLCVCGKESDLRDSSLLLLCLYTQQQVCACVCVCGRYRLLHIHMGKMATPSSLLTFWKIVFQMSFFLKFYFLLYVHF